MSILDYFPFPHIRERQRTVLLEIESAIKSGYRNIFLEAPTGFGKTAVAITLARYLGSSHICTATKDLQAQYRRDFSFVFEVKGRGNFPCIVKEDVGLDESCEYGPCVKDEDYDCAFKTRLLDYDVIGQGTTHETVRINSFAEKTYVDNLRKQPKLVQSSWRPCHYFHQKWAGAKSSHTVYNYRYFLSDIFYTGSMQTRKLLVLDEAHSLESEVGDFRSFTVNKNTLKFLPKVQLPENRIEEIETWISFLSRLQDKLLQFIEPATDAIERGRISEPYTERNLIEAISRERNVSAVLYDMRASKKNWIVSNISHGNDGKVWRVTLTPLDTSGYFGDILDKGTIAFFMSATILSKEYLCKVSGIKSDTVKFIQVRDSDFPVKNRLIRLMNVAWLSAKTMQESLPKISKAVDNIMSTHRNDKGIIHTTSYAQLNFIRDTLSKENSSRLIETGPSIPREEVLEKHTTSQRPTVLISPSLHLGVDLKDDLSRFQVIIKVPYPDLTDRRVAAMKQKDPQWYTWHTVLRLAQAYGRCLSEDTQILTRTGWKTKDEVSIGDEVLGLDSRVFEKNNRTIYKKIPRLQWSKVLEIHQFDTDKEMISIQGKGVDALVTKDHTMIIIPNNHTRKARHNSNVKDVIGSSYGLQKIVAENLPRRFRIPVAGYLPVTKGHGNGRRLKEWSELMGIVISDGNISRTKRAVTIYQSDVEIKKPVVERIEELLSTLQLIYRKDMTSKMGEDVFGYKRKGRIITWVIHGVDAEKVRDYIFAGRFRVRYRENKNSRRRKILIEYEEKSKIPWWIMTAGRKIERESLLQGLMLGGGSWYGENSGTYFTSNPELADFMQALLVSLGYRTHLVRRIDGKNEHEVRFTREAWSEMSGDSVKRGVIYDRKTWCVTTGNGTIVTRRNGSVAITGNSIRSKDDYATTYILDSNIDYLLKSAQGMIPKWFSEAIRT